MWVLDIREIHRCAGLHITEELCDFLGIGADPKDARLVKGCEWSGG